MDRSRQHRGTGSGGDPDFAEIQRLTTLLHSTKDPSVRRQCRYRLARLRVKRAEILAGESS